jgi:hypothetical protein
MDFSPNVTKRVRFHYMSTRVAAAWHAVEAARGGSQLQGLLQSHRYSHNIRLCLAAWHVYYLTKAIYQSNNMAGNRKHLQRMLTTICTWHPGSKLCFDSQSICRALMFCLHFVFPPSPCLQVGVDVRSPSSAAQGYAAILSMHNQLMYF